MMQPIINEWQLGTKLNVALQQQHRADFALWLAVLSPAVEEMAAFYTPQASQPVPDSNLYQQLAVTKRRSFAVQPSDSGLWHKYSEAALLSLAQLKLQIELNPAPWVLQDDAKKLDSQLLAGLDHHCLRKRVAAPQQVAATDETALYEILQQLNNDVATELS